MSLRSWLNESYNRIREEGAISGIQESAYWFYVGAAGRLSPLKSGISVYDRDWDLLIVLDACRADLMSSVVSDYGYETPIETTTSMGSTSAEWLRKNFTNEYAEETRDTIHVTGNLYSETELNPESFFELEEVWRDAWDNELGTVRPREITDHVIRYSRQEDPGRIIAHYMQPHYPFLTEPDLAPGMQSDEGYGNVWTQLRRGYMDYGDVVKAYRANLRLVLDEVELLLSNVDAETAVITADHGNAIGEWGIYGHPWGIPISCLREVPWIVTSGRDKQEYKPTIDNRETEGDFDVQERLAALGYAE